MHPVGVATLKDIVFDCADAARLARFWAAALDGFEVRPYDDAEVRRLAALGLTPDTDPSVMVDGPHGSLCFQEVAEPKVMKNRVHLDLHCDDRAAAIDQLVRAGASLLSEHDDHAVLADAEGNEFCLYDTQ